MLLRHEARARGRSGITLTEILISIMIMGVGIVSLATLFPLGLVRLRNAQRMTRSGLLAESVKADLNTHNLLAQFSFTNALISPWYQSPGMPAGFTSYNPWVQDTPFFMGNWAIIDATTSPPSVSTYLGVNNSVGSGLPVAYDPLWRANASNPFPSGTAANPAYLNGIGNGIGVYEDLSGTQPASEARFGSGINFLRNDPDGGTASAYGLQRLTNFRPDIPGTAPPVRNKANDGIILNTFVSHEDIIMQEAKAQYTDPNNANLKVAAPSTVVPDLSGGPAVSPSVVNDWRYTWMFTGVQADVSNGTVFTGDVVVFENRQFGYDQIRTPSGGTAYQATGETVVEAVWGYTTTAPPVTVPPYPPYGLGVSRQVLLRWPATMPDPDVHVGGWIADVTYERVQDNENLRTQRVYPLQRCEWYQIAKRTDPGAGASWSTDGRLAYRSIMVWVSTPVRDRTPMNFLTTPIQPLHVEAALIAPSVVSVFPKTVYTR
jgi:hypothetical protein